MFRRSWRHAAAATAALLALTSITACSDDPAESQDLSENRAGAMDGYAVGTQFKATEPVSFPILYNNHPNYPLKNDWLFWSELKSRTNVTLEPVAVPLSDYEQKRSLLIGAGDAPLLLPKTYPSQEEPYVSSGAILPVSDYLNLMPNLSDKIEKWNLGPEIDTRRQDDGKFYLLPGLHEKAWHDYSLAVRTDILEELNLEVPKTWDDLYLVLKAMKAAYPDVYPFSDRFSQPNPGGNLLNILAFSYGLQGAGWNFQHTSWNAQAQKFEYTGATEQYKQMLQYLNKLVSEKLLDPESFTQTDDKARQKLANSQSFVISANAQAVVNDYRPDLSRNPDAKIAKIPLPIGPAGEINPADRLENGLMISSKARDSKNFVAMMQFVDWLFYSDEGQEFAKWGVEGQTFVRDAAGKPTLAPDVDIIGLNPGAPKHLQKDFGFYNGVFAYGGKPELVQAFFSEEEQQFQEVMNARAPRVVPPPHPFTDEEREQVSLWATPLRDHVYQATLQFILGQRDFAQWDAYLAELKSKNMDSYMETVTKAYERFRDKNN
ncbi:putative aldouronate transport system substrate-binding protein [Micromonospora phaseoli]|uniref:Putative aldouronate transport system substrate-binding protein n=1 Tax=Micromonospora phaseoli TaxID=1144548 RepID=A0A1H6VHB7_9ACTN|nr:extracellular solute-binding protein [Micromonospora phaseoli]PZV93653.1 putative aldouronate transport system substrate-binding protein [Micromonospora phaseoli]GIJ79793.1 sugar ABC transporter substrate-binding protein [Micromonospora phaseoli]SEJ01147.1 putative aldouronate transport system substrate-binding protein [Micromonospora phaseoli]